MLVGRMTGLIIIIGASVVALAFADVFGQFKMAVELPIFVCRPVLGRHVLAGLRESHGGLVHDSVLTDYLLCRASVLPRIMPSLYDHPALSATTQVVTTTIERTATESDVAKREAWLKATEALDGDARPNCSAASLPKRSSASRSRSFAKVAENRFSGGAASSRLATSNSKPSKRLSPMASPPWCNVRSVIGPAAVR